MSDTDRGLDLVNAETTTDPGTWHRGAGAMKGQASGGKMISGSELGGQSAVEDDIDYPAAADFTLAGD